MTSPKIEGWFYVSVTLKSLIDGTSTKTLKLSNRPIIEEADGSTVYFPVLKAITGIGAEAGDVIPQPRTGSIVLDNTPGSFGIDRRIGDLFERYTIFGQPVQIYVAQTIVDDTTINAEFALAWTSTGLTWEASGDDLRIDVAEVGLANTVMSKVVDTVTFPSAPSGSLGKYIPLVLGFGSVVAPVCTVDQDSAKTSIEYAYRTTLGSTFAGWNSQGMTAWYAKDIDSQYRQISSAASSGSSVYTTTGGAVGGVVTIGTTAVAMKLSGTGTGSGGSSSQVLKGGTLKIYGNNTAGTVSGYIDVQIVRGITVNGVSTPDPTRVVCAGRIDKANWSANWNAGLLTEATISFNFNKLGVVHGELTHWLIVSGSNEAGASVTRFTYQTGVSLLWQKATSDTQFGATANLFDLRVGMTGIGITDTQSPDSTRINAQGLGHSRIVLDASTAPTGQTNPDLNTLDLLVRCAGIGDDGSGTISGVVRGQINKASQVIKMLDCQYGGSTWTRTGSKIDFTAFSTTFNDVGGIVNGYSEGRATFADLVAAICRSTASKIVRYNGASQQFTFYQWGNHLSTAAVITDETCQLKSVKVLGGETVVNRMVVHAVKDLTYSNLVAGVAQGNFAPYSKTVTYDIATSTLAATFSTISVALFGRNELADNSFDWLSVDSALAGGGTAAQFADGLASYILSTYALPHMYAELEVPLLLYSALDSLNVVEIVHPGLPAYFGSAANARLPYYSGAVTDLVSGQYFKRGKRYRGIIEGKQFNANVGGFPTLTLNCRLLTNSAGGDPT
jgi:hypothetical protein